MKPVVIVKELDKEVNQLVKIVVKRYETIGIKLSPADIDNIYYTLLGIADRNGIDKARKEAENAKLLMANKKSCINNGFHFPTIKHIEEGKED